MQREQFNIESWRSTVINDDSLNGRKEFEDDEDVQNVFHNLEITEEVMAEMEE